MVEKKARVYRIDTDKGKIVTVKTVAEGFWYNKNFYIVLSYPNQEAAKDCLRKEGVIFKGEIKGRNLRRLIGDYAAYLSCQSDGFNRAMNLLGERKSVRVVDGEVYEGLKEVLSGLKEQQTKVVDSLLEKLSLTP